MSPVPVARRFLVLGHTQPALPPIPLNDAAGAGGRWDVLARCVTSALLVSHGIRRDTEIVLFLGGPGGPRTVRVSGSRVQNLNPDERSTVALLSKALGSTDVGDHETESLPGIFTSRRSLERVLQVAQTDSTLVFLEEAAPGVLEAWQPRGAVTFVLSDHRDPTTEEHGALLARRPERVSLGPVSLQGDQCIVVAHNRIDRALVPASPSVERNL